VCRTTSDLLLNSAPHRARPKPQSEISSYLSHQLSPTSSLGLFLHRFMMPSAHKLRFRRFFIMLDKARQWNGSTDTRGQSRSDFSHERTSTLWHKSNSTLRHLIRLKSRPCHIALSVVSFTSPYRDYAIALLPASSSPSISPANLTTVGLFNPRKLVHLSEFMQCVMGAETPAFRFEATLPFEGFVEFHGTAICLSCKF
jgi:hypothetical protein